MTKQWQKDLSLSARRFTKVVYPEIRDCWFDGAAVAPVESVSKKQFADELDQLAGVDYWVVKSEHGMRGLASRVQTHRDWSTFTVRHSRPSGVDTELQKRRESINEGYLYPYWTLQAYVPNGSLENVARCQTEDLIEYIDTGKRGEHYTDRSSPSGEQFFTVHWADFGRRYSIDIYSDIDCRAELGKPEVKNQVTLLRYGGGT